MIEVHPEVADALAGGRAVVALESAVITAGLPREPWASSSNVRIEGWRNDRPANLELALAIERAVRAGGAIPATIAVLDGRLRIGLGSAEIERLALEPRSGKAAVTDLAILLAQQNASAGTTVSATLAAIRAAGFMSPRTTQQRTHNGPACPIRVFATGGIGGVHRNWQQSPDISADLKAIANTPVCVVCSGAKSILDVPATLEALETLGVPVLGWRTQDFPNFNAVGTISLPLRHRVDSAVAAAAICHSQWRDLRRAEGIVLANPIPAGAGIDTNELEAALAIAESSALAKRMTGAERTPFLLREVARLTDGRSLESNLALLVNNASVAAEVAVEIARENQAVAG